MEENNKNNILSMEKSEYTMHDNYAGQL